MHAGVVRDMENQRIKKERQEIAELRELSEELYRLGRDMSESESMGIVATAVHEVAMVLDASGRKNEAYEWAMFGTECALDAEILAKQEKLKDVLSSLPQDWKLSK